MLQASLLVLGLLLLLAGGTAVVRGASAVAAHYGVSPLVVGLTVVAFGTSAPELVVNVAGALAGETALAFGNVSGSNLANIGLVLGTAAVLAPITIESGVVRRELPLLLLGTTALLIMILDRRFLGLSPELTRPDALILLLIFGIFFYVIVQDVLQRRSDPLRQNLLDVEEKMPSAATGGVFREWLWASGGLVLLTAGGQVTVDAGSELAQALGVRPVIVGLMIVAVGTSLPEFVTSMIAAARGESDLCLGNVVGSNIFNALFVLPISALVKPLPVPGGGALDVTVSLAFAGAIIIVFYVGRGRMSRGVGGTLVLAYFGYMGFRLSSPALGVP